MNPGSRNVQIAVGAAVALLVVFVIIVRLGRQPQEPAPALREPESLQAPQPMKPSERVLQRLEQLRASRARLSKGEPDERVQARGSVAAVPKRVVPGAGPAQMQEAPSGTDTQDGAEDDSLSPEPDPDDIPGLKSTALQDPDPDRRLAAISLLGATEDPQVIPTLGQALADTDEEVRMAALESLSDFTDEPPVDAIESALNDPSADIRFEALDVLSDIGGDRARSAVERALNDPDDDVRALAEGILDLEQTYEPAPGSQPDAAGADAQNATPPSR